VNTLTGLSRLCGNYSSSPALFGSRTPSSLSGSALKLKQLIASSCRQKILVALAKVKKTHITNLVRMINSTYNQVNRNIEILEKEGIIKIQSCGRLRIVELQTGSPKTQALLKALNILERPIKDIQGQGHNNDTDP